MYTAIDMSVLFNSALRAAGSGFTVAALCLIH